MRNRGIAIEIRLSDAVREFLSTAQGREVSLSYLRNELKIKPETPEWHNLRMVMTRLSREKVVKPSGRNDGVYKVVHQVKRVIVFDKSRETREPFDLKFPRDFYTGDEMVFAENIILREGDLVSIGGVSNFGKTCIALNFGGENIDLNPVLMGNEYTTRVGETDEYDATPRFVNRLEKMDWVEWVNGDGSDKFELLPVREDYAEHIVKNRINIIDWINLEASRLYDISKVMDDIKAEIGRGIAIVVLQKGEDATSARGGQFTKDFTDCELLIDKFTDKESMLTIGKVKEYSGHVIGRKFAFSIDDGVKIANFREIKKCTVCRGAGNVHGKECQTCMGNRYVNKYEI